MKRDKYRRSWNRVHKAYERKVYNIFKKYFVDEANRIPFNSLTEDNYIATINNNIKIYKLYNTYYDVYNLIGIMHGNRIGKGINRDVKDFNPVSFQSEYQRDLYNWIIENIGYRIVSVHQSYREYIQKLIANGLLEGKGMREITSEIQTLINRSNFYRYQALRIARTETTAASNRGAYVAGQSSGIVLDKVWISGLDARTRRKPPIGKSHWDHNAMNGVKIGKDDHFVLESTLGEVDEILYPGALLNKNKSKTHPGNVINCRCTVALLPRRDSRGRIMRN